MRAVSLFYLARGNVGEIQCIYKWPSTMAIKSHKQQQQQQQQRLNTHLQDLKYKHYYPLGFNLYCIVMPCVE